MKVYLFLAGLVFWGCFGIGLFTILKTLLGDTFQ